MSIVVEGMHRRCWELIRALDVPVRCREPDMLAAARLYLRRNIKLYEWSSIERLTGAVVDRPGIGVEIWIDRSLSPIHRCHVIAHELGHVLLGHTAESGAGRHLCGIGNTAPRSDIAALVMPVDSQRSRLREEEAELFALLLLGLREPEVPITPRPRRAMSQIALRRMESAFPCSLAATGARRERVG